MSISPEVCVDRGQATLYVATTDGELQAISASAGEPVAEVAVAGLPVAASDGVVVLVDRPGEQSLGSVSLVEHVPAGSSAAASDLVLRWTSPLLDPAEFEQVRHELAEADFSAEIGSTEIGVVGRFRLRYRGGTEPPIDATDAQPSDYDMAASYDRATGRRTARAPVDVRALPDGDEPTPAAPDPQIVPVDPVAGQWVVRQPEGGTRTVQLDPGTVAAQIVDDRVLYRVVETPADGSGTRRYLRSRPIDPDQGPGWSHLVEQSAAGPPPLRP